MVITSIETQSSLQIQSSHTQSRKHLTPLRPKGDDADQTKEESQLRGASPIQDRVSLSREAQALSVSDSETSKNSTFQQSPSPFDR